MAGNANNSEAGQQQAPAVDKTNDVAAVAAAAAAKAKQTAADAALETHNAEMRNLEAESRRLEILERKANLEDVTERLDERRMRREAVAQRAYTNGATLRDTAQREAMIQKRCNHKKGGNGASGVQLGQGDNPQHAVIKHSMLNGDLWIRCQRCGKTWKPPIKGDYAEGGLLAKLGIEGYVQALTEYETAKVFQTNNSPSSSQQFQWSDGGAYSREVLRSTTLR